MASTDTPLYGPGRWARRRALRLEFEELEANEARLIQELADTRIRKEALRAQESALAPVYALSDDLLAEIFEIAFMHDCGYCITHPEELPPGSPIPLLYVSRRFRLIAVDLPRLWRCIHIQGVDGRVTPLLIRMYVRRSQDIPLCVILNTAELEHWADTGGYDLIGDCVEWFRICNRWRLLCDEMHRWRYLNIHANRPQVVRALTEFNLDTPMLEYWRISHTWSHFITRPKFENKSPSLVSFATHDLKLRPVTFQLNHLVVLSLEKILVRPEHWDTFSKCALPNLEKLTLTKLDKTAFSATVALRPLCYSKLRQLGLVDVDLSDFLPLIHAPQLDTVFMQGCIPITASDAPPFHEDTFSHVVRLIICKQARWASKFGPVFELFPSVVSLETDDKGILDLLFDNNFLFEEMKFLTSLVLPSEGTLSEFTLLFLPRWQANIMPLEKIRLPLELAKDLHAKEGYVDLYDTIAMDTLENIQHTYLDWRAMELPSSLDRFLI